MTMVEYTVEVYMSTLTEKKVYITLMGTTGDSIPQEIQTSPCQTVPTTQVLCQESVGTLLLVKLEVRPGFFLSKEWFCGKIVVTTPEGETVHFPCYQWLDSKKPTVYLRDDKGTLKGKETGITFLFQRQHELNLRARNFKWKEYVPGLPYIIDAATATDLPHEVRFSFKKTTEIEFNAGKAMFELRLGAHINCSDTWSSLEKLHSHLRYPKPNAYVVEHWKDDAFFGYQFLNGLNPMMIRCCSELPSNFPVTGDMVKSSLKGHSLNDEMQKGNIFICDYKRLDGFTGNVINKTQQFLAAPVCLLYSTPEKQLIPVAIQLYQEPGQENPIFLPTDSEWDWLLAKIFVRNAEFNEHELNFHLLQTHLLAEVFSLSTIRNLPSAHPLFKLLMPHTRYTFQINIMARNALISKGGIFDKYTAIGGENRIETFLLRAVSSLTYSSLCLPDNIKERGLENIPNYYYREDGLKLWNIILEFVRAMLACYYKSDDDVMEDSELQKWIKEIFHYGFQENQKSGMPESFSSVEEVVKFVTMVIFTVSAQHAAVNNGQFEFGGWMPNLPTSLRRPPPKSKGEATEKTILETLPDVTTTIHGLAVLYLLSTKSADNYPLGDYKEELFGEKEPRRLIQEFQAALQRLDEEIQKRNKGLDLPFVHLQPPNVDNSVNL